MINNWSESASSTSQMLAKMQCRRNYLRALVVKFNKGREMLKFMLIQFKSNTPICARNNKTITYIKHNWKYFGLHKYHTKRGMLNLNIIK